MGVKKQGRSSLIRPHSASLLRRRRFTPIDVGRLQPQNAVNALAHFAPLADDSFAIFPSRITKLNDSPISGNPDNE